MNNISEMEEFIKKIDFYTGTNNMDRLMLLKSKGIELSLIEMVYIFGDRQTGKTFSSYCSIALYVIENRNLTLEYKREVLLIKPGDAKIYIDNDLYVLKGRGF
jgi:hypothetical protein